MQHILITGGTGLIGMALSSTLKSNGYKVSILTRKKDIENGIHWDLEKGTIESDKMMDVDVIIHLAGEGIADKPWSNKRKKEIIDSRVQTANFLYNFLKNNTHQVKTFISSSAIGYYSDRGDELLTEESIPSHDFLSSSCIAWENAVEPIRSLNIRLLKIRTGIVLSLNGGALPKMIQPIKWGLGSPLGTGKQWMSWIHINDLCNMYQFAVENPIEGVFNAAAPNPLRNKEFTKCLAKAIHRPMFLPNVPSFVLKAILGEMSIIVLGSTKVSSDKIISKGFKFQYPFIEPALCNLLNTHS